MTSPNAAGAAAGTSNPASNAQALQSVLTDLSTVTLGQLVALFRQYGDRPDFALLLKQAFPDILRPHAEAAATITAQWYDELAPRADFNATPVVDLAPERLAKSVDWALYAPGDAQPLDRLAGSAKRMVYDAARDTIVDNASQEKVRWARYAQPDACAFCRVLATRSGDALYRSEHSAQFVVGRGGQPRGSRKLGEKYHDHCRCLPFPVREGDYEPPDYTQQWQKQYEDARKAGNYGLKTILAHMRSNTDAH